MSSFAIVPAAGRSRRMGSPKLLLPFGEMTLIERVLAAWRASRVDRILAVVHADDHELAARCRGERTTIVAPMPLPPEMKDSVAAALRHIADAYGPTATDCWLLAPADIPNLSPATIDRLLTALQRTHSGRRADAPSCEPSTPTAPGVGHDVRQADENLRTILVPAHGGRRGHPVLFPWALADEVFLLRDGEGVNQLLKRHPAVEVPCLVDELGQDVDTVDDYRRLTQS